jgi:hypothetical protein
MTRRRRLPLRALALGLALAALVAGGRAAAVAAAPAGSKNFTPPSDVPNYFSNESGPFQGGANARDGQSDTAAIAAASASRGRAVTLSRRNPRHHAARLAKARGRTRLAHAKAGAHRHFAHAGTASAARTVRAQVRSAIGHAIGKAGAAKSHAAASKNKRVARAHG